MALIARLVTGLLAVLHGGGALYLKRCVTKVAGDTPYRKMHEQPS